MKSSLGYFISTDGNLWAEIESGEAVVPVAQDSELYIRAICQYSNPEKAEFTFTKSIWNFELDISAVSTAISSLTYDNELPEVANGLSDGKALEIPEEEKFVYELSEDGNYIYFGEYPQTLKASNVTVSTTPDADGYFLGSDGERYYEYTIDIDFETLSELSGTNYDEETWSSMDQLDASTGEEMANGGKYYFKMEKIKWRILEEDNGTYTIVADTNLQALTYQPDYFIVEDELDGGKYLMTTANGATDGAAACEYQYSELRRFLNDDFMDIALNESQKNLIQSTILEDGVTTDNIFALSKSQVETYIGNYDSEEFYAWVADLETSDFARATGVTTLTKTYWMFGGDSEEEAMEYEDYFNTGVSWLTSPNYLAPSLAVYGVGAITIPTSYASALPVYLPFVGMVPALQLDLSGADEYTPLASETLISGPELSTLFMGYGDGTATYANVIFDYATPENLALVENATKSVSVAEDGSDNIMFYEVGTTAYILSSNKIYANEDCSYMFFSMEELEKTMTGGGGIESKYASIQFNNFDTSNVTNMSGMFMGCVGVTTLDLSSFDTSKVTNMFAMFAFCSGVTSLDLSSFNTSKVTNMGTMFCNCSSLTSLDVSSFDTGNVTDMSIMFSGLKLTSLDLSTFDTKNVTNMGWMFDDCKNLKSLDVSTFDTSNVTSMCVMFRCCSALTSLDLSSWDTSNVTDMAVMFNLCSSLTTLDLSTFDTSKVTDMRGMFFECSNLVTIYVSNDWTTSAVTSGENMFGNCSKLVGGNGTAYSSANQTHTYAVIDTAETPGYLTLKEN